MAADPSNPSSPIPRPGEQPYKPPRVPPGTSTLGVWLFLTTLFILFVAVLVAYLFIRLVGAQSPPLHTIHFPPLLWLSTALVISASISLSRCLSALRRERQAAFRNWLRASLVFGVGFIVVQVPAMIELFHAHQAARRTGLFLYGLALFLIFIHALHVIGGIIVLTRVYVQGERGVYDHEHFLPVRHTALYWHFLDLVWITMFLTFLATG